MTLSPRQQQVLRLIALSQTTEQIARKLKISEETVKKHRFKIRYRLGIQDIAGLTRYAIKSGLLGADNT